MNFIIIKVLGTRCLRQHICTVMEVYFTYINAFKLEQRNGYALLL